MSNECSSLRNSISSRTGKKKYLKSGIGFLVIPRFDVTSSRVVDRLAPTVEAAVKNPEWQSLNGVMNFKQPDGRESSPLTFFSKG